jgi:hypothetical protein
MHCHWQQTQCRLFRFFSLEMAKYRYKTHTEVQILGEMCQFTWSRAPYPSIQGEARLTSTNVTISMLRTAANNREHSRGTFGTDAHQNHLSHRANQHAWIAASNKRSAAHTFFRRAHLQKKCVRLSLSLSCFDESCAQRFVVIQNNERNDSFVERRRRHERC